MIDQPDKPPPARAVGLENRIEVVYALPDRQITGTMDWYEGLTIAQAVQRSGILERFPDYKLEAGRVGVFGERQPLDHVLQPGDRVELYRPLTMSPTAARRLRAEGRR